MKAITSSRYGGPEELQLSEVASPTPGPDEVLVTVHAASVNAADWHLMRGDPFLLRLGMGLLRPKYALGADVAGRVAAVGRDVKRFKVGDEVFGDVSNCAFGAFAELARAKEASLAFKPKSVSFAQAAAAPMAGVTAMHALKKAGQSLNGKRVLVNGASSGVGSFAVQLAKVKGAHVTAAAAGGKLAAVETLGADAVVDSGREDLTRGEQRFDVIIDAAAYRSAFAFRHALSPGGAYVMAGGGMGALFQVMLLGAVVSAFTGKKFCNFLSVPDQTALSELARLMESGQVKPLIDREFGLPQVPDAIRHVEARRARGKVVIAVAA